MPRKLTLIASPYGRGARPAAGLHDPVAVRTYLFADFKRPSGRRRRTLIAGRGGSCDIRVRDTYASSQHIKIDCPPNKPPLVTDLASTNGVFVDGSAKRKPFNLAEGMQLRLGNMHLYAVDRHGRFPITATTIDEFLRHAARIYGNNTIGGERIGVSRETIRRRLIRLLKRWT